MFTRSINTIIKINEKTYCETTMKLYDNNVKNIKKYFILENIPKGKYRAIQIDNFNYSMIIEADNFKTLFKVIMSEKYNENEKELWIWNKGE